MTSQPLFPHGVSCGRCAKTLMAGGNDEQRPYYVCTGTVGPDMPPWATDEALADLYEIVCKRCHDEVPT